MTPTAPPPGLCETCWHGKRLESARGSVFWLCLKHDQDPTFPKYPRLPVLHCVGYRARPQDP